MLENTSRRKIAYYSINDPLDKRSWSGITYYLGQTLQKNIGEVHFLGPVKIPWFLDKTFRALQKLSRFFFRSEWIPKYSLLKNIYACWILKRKMKGHDYDLLVAPAAASELGYLNTRLPIVYFGDATYKAYSETYEKEFKGSNKFSRWEGNHLEKRSLKKSSLIVLTSRWAAQSAINDYGVPASKIEVILLGANIDHPPARDIIFQKEANKTLTLLFLAVDWERKGGAIAFAALEQLHKMGIQARLVVCGVVPPPQFVHPCMEVIPFLNKNEAADYRRFVALLSSVHFLVVPTRADCSLLVSCEANAYGVPTISTAVGGVNDVVKDGVNGYCLPPEAGGAAYAQKIAAIFADKERYHQLVLSSRRRFEEELNWDSFADHFHQVLEKHAL
ncbi:MAG: glycosyltransferase family 4 protein [Williamsia sp.]|nr:glycosyltransferase family 4 protein [Williamsia sp.]